VLPSEKAAILAASRAPIPIVSNWRPPRARATWRAYLSSPETATAKGINARDRIGNGPWQNAKGVVIAQNVDDLHSVNNKLSRETALTERGTMVSGIGYTPVWHDALTGSDRAGRVPGQHQHDLQQLV
jgi:hypothetical protein